MTNAYIKGVIEADEGYIGHWAIKGGSLVSTTSGSNSMVINGTTGISSRGHYRFWVNANSNSLDENTGIPTGDNAFPTDTTKNYFWVDSSGKLSCRNATVNGHIEADSGRIGNLNITNNGLSWIVNGITNHINLSGSKLTVGNSDSHRDIYDSFVTHDNNISDLNSRLSTLSGTVSSNYSTLNSAISTVSGNVATLSSTVTTLSSTVEGKSESWVQGIVNKMSLNATAVFG
ncbi:MAG: hypothetical protein NC548_25645 [Lachnospiraceae bacterium]|nr:hypothetical protein [Lachnospiraceae bacterium]